MRPTPFLAVLILSLTVAISAHAAGGWDPSETTPEESGYLSQAQEALERNQWEWALRLLDQATHKNPTSADAHNLKGFAARQLGRLDVSLQHYERALSIDPDHKRAHEYLGQLYITMGKPEEALRLLARLDTLCPRGCPERDDLAQALGGK